MTPHRWIFAAAAGLLAAAWGLALFVYFTTPSWFWHPLATGAGTTCSATNHTGCGYAFWSGFGSDIGEVTIVGGLITIVLGVWTKHNCHVHGCPWLSWHPDPEHGHPVCKKHHPDSHQNNPDHPLHS